MKIKIQKMKFIRNIIIGVTALFIVAFIINIAPGYKRNKYKEVINLVIMDENVTEKLKNPICKDEDGGIYLSKEDMMQFFDENLYYDEEYERIITTSNISVGSMKVGEKIICINNSMHDTLYSVINNNNIIYIPIQEMEMVYNINVEYIKDNNIVVIDKLDEGLIKAEADTKTDIRLKPRGLSKKVGTLKKGDNVSAFYTTSKGWRLIRTKDGIVGYVKANVLTNEYIVRQDMEYQTITKEITANVNENSIIEIDGKTIIIEDFVKQLYNGAFKNNYEEYLNDYEVWLNLELSNSDVEDYEIRTNLIKNSVALLRKNNIKGINIVINNNENIKRFIIELAPRLREIGIKTNIITSESKYKEEYNSIVNYIIKPE